MDRDSEEEVPTSTTRRTSQRTGLSYLCSGNLVRPPQKLYVCCHGWACSATDYNPLISALAALDAGSSRGILHVSLDLPGHGGSPSSICPVPTVPFFATLVNEVRRELSPQHQLLDTVLVGHSMGCRTALEAFCQQPANVSAIILLDGSWVGNHPEAHAAPVLEKRGRELERIAARIAMYGPLTPVGFKEEVERRFKDLDLKYEYELSRNYIEWDRMRMEEVLSEIAACDGVRVLALQSTQGRGANRKPLQAGEEGPWLPFVRDKIGKARFASVVLHGCGHWPHVDKKDEVARIIHDYAETS